MKFEIFFAGLVVITMGILILIVNLYIRNKDQGIVGESNYILALFFGLVDWKNNKIPLLVVCLGVVITLIPMVI